MSRLTNLTLLFLAAVLLFFAVFGSHGLLHLVQVNQELEELERQNRLIESDIVGLENKIYGVSKSEELLERLAREELGLSKPGEIVYIFPELSAADEGYIQSSSNED